MCPNANHQVHCTVPDGQTLQAGAVLAVDKPLRWTSFDVVKKLRACWHVKKIGHAGTLDPLATGLLVVCTGQETKSIPQYQALEKVYRGTMVLGKTTPSIDLETPFDSDVPWGHVLERDLAAAAGALTGALSQVPPAYSAVKLHGERAYKRARRGLATALAPREVYVHSFVLTAVRLPCIDFEVTCGKGTYIRSLVRDFGQLLGTGAYLSALCRTRIGPFRLEEALTLTTICYDDVH